MHGSNRLTRAVHRSIAALGCALLLGACTTWSEQSSPTPAMSRPVKHVRLTRTDGTVVMLEEASVQGDSIVGTPPLTTGRAAVALADVKKAEIRRIDPSATVWTVGIVAGLLYYLLPGLVYLGEAT
ncbi:MAG TPA: hypothetical protein VFJ82_23070 [Longimicrobium sp.]|nr:hypothetical protein [Longimicrobium sp.]